MYSLFDAALHAKNKFRFAAFEHHSKFKITDAP